VQCCKDKQDNGETDPSCMDVDNTPCTYWDPAALDACCTSKAAAGIYDATCPQSPLSPIGWQCSSRPPADQYQVRAVEAWSS